MGETVEIGGVTAEVARSFWARLKGLIGRQSLPPGRGLLILKCNAIHTFFMRVPIDATFYDREDRVVKTSGRPKLKLTALQWLTKVSDLYACITPVTA